MAISVQYATATADGSGDAVFTFPDVPVGSRWSGPTTIPNAPSTFMGTVYAGGALIGPMLGPGIYGSWTTDHAARLSIVATGLVVHTQYQAVWHVDDSGITHPVLPTPVAPGVATPVIVPDPLPTEIIAPDPLPISGTVDLAAGTVVGTEPTAAPVTGQQTSNTSQVQLSAVPTQPPNALFITALAANAAPVFYGATGVTTATGDELAPGQVKPVTCPPNAVFIIGANNTDKVSWSLT